MYQRCQKCWCFWTNFWKCLRSSILSNSLLNANSKNFCKNHAANNKYRCFSIFYEIWYQRSTLDPKTFWIICKQAPSAFNQSAYSPLISGKDKQSRYLYHTFVRSNTLELGGGGRFNSIISWESFFVLHYLKIFLEALKTSET